MINPSRKIIILISAMALFGLLFFSTKIQHQPTVAGDSDERQTGMNLYEINDWQPAWVFVDVIKMARDWSDCNKWDSKPSVPLTADGYPTEMPYGSLTCVNSIWAHNWLHWPAGDYTFTFEGNGTVQLKGKNYSSTGGKVVFSVNFSSSEGAPILKITRSDKSNPIRNMHLIMPGFADTYETQIFHPDFLAGLAGVDELRFMNWMRTNWEWADTEPAPDFFDWANRTKTTSFTQTRTWGVAPEYVAELANRLGVDAWINIPYTASDDFVTNYAKFLNDNLNPGLKVYIEYSNELWNGGTFRHYKYASNKGIELGLETDIIAASRAYHIYRTMQIFKIFQDQFSDDSRLINVVASQAANSWWGKQLLQYLDKPAYNPYGIEVDALAIAPYFSTSPNPTSDSTVDDILNLAQQGVYSHTQAWTRSNMSMIKTYCNNKGLADKCIRLVTYEGGQHLRSADTAINDKFILANRHERMGELFDEMFDVWEAENPGELFTIFVYSSSFGQYGSWGMFEYQDAMDTPKYNAYRRRLGDGSNCTESWSCTAWSPAICPASGIQTCTCTDSNNCGTAINKPAESRSCVYACSPDWSCTAWSPATCPSSQVQTRTCTDSNNCGTATSTSQSCVYTPSTTPCSPNWVCTGWSVCSSSGRQIRTCTDSNSCGTATGKPSESQSCVYTPPNSGGGGGGGGASSVVVPESTSTSNALNANNSTTGDVLRELVRDTFYKGRYVKLANDSAIYYISSSSTRSLFSNEITYWTWNIGLWKNQIIETISQAEFDKFSADKNVTVRPGTGLIKFANSQKLYTILPNDKLCGVYGLYSKYWLDRIINIQDAFETDYIKDNSCEITNSSKYPDGSLIQYAGSDEIYYILDGRKHWVSPEVFTANKFKEANVIKFVPTFITYDTGWDLEEW